MPPPPWNAGITSSTPTASVPCSANPARTRAPAKLSVPKPAKRSLSCAVNSPTQNQSAGPSTRGPRHPPGRHLQPASVYRFLAEHGLDSRGDQAPTATALPLRSGPTKAFECALANELWDDRHDVWPPASSWPLVKSSIPASSRCGRLFAPGAPRPVLRLRAARRVFWIVSARRWPGGASRKTLHRSGQDLHQLPPASHLRQPRRALVPRQAVCGLEQGKNRTAGFARSKRTSKRAWSSTGARSGRTQTNGSGVGLKPNTTCARIRRCRASARPSASRSGHEPARRRFPNRLEGLFLARAQRRVRLDATVSWKESCGKSPSICAAKSSNCA